MNTQPIAESSASNGNYHGYEVLIVEDSASMRTILKHTLEGFGFRLVVAEDGIEALKCLETSNPNLIITDINMPNLGGMGLIEKVRALDQFQDRPILVVSTENAIDTRQQARRLGANGWIVKPFKEEQLMTAVRRLLH